MVMSCPSGLRCIELDQVAISAFRFALDLEVKRRENDLHILQLLDDRKEMMNALAL